VKGVLVVGRHCRTHVSIDDKLVDEMFANETVDVLYTDPSWGDGNLNYGRP